MNIAKIINALEQTDELTSGMLISEDGKLHCALGQLFYVAGFVDEKMLDEQEIYHWNEMFDRVLFREYGMSDREISQLWHFNDCGTWGESSGARQMRVVAYLKDKLKNKKESIECQTISHSSSQVEEELKVCVGV